LTNSTWCHVCEGFLIHAGQTELLTKNYGKTAQDSGASAGPSIQRRKWNWLGHKLRRSDDGITKQTGATVDTARPQRKTVTKEYLEKRSRERKCVYSRIQVQLEEDGAGSTRQSWMEISGLWLIFHRERQGISQNQVNTCN